MKDNSHQSPRIYTYKDTQFNCQFQATYTAFYDGSKTMLEVAFELNILRANICRYVDDLKKSDRIYLVGYRLCSISKHTAGIYTTNPENKPEDNQLKMF